MTICAQSLRELRATLLRKAPQAVERMEEFLAGVSFELIDEVPDGPLVMRDPDDQPILNAAVSSGMDLIVSGDRDFLCLDMERPRCVSVAWFLENMAPEEDGSPKENV